ncbi:MAG: phage integrase N-terminal SAM-like domain-containing protein [Pseudomonadales bacterium]|nr:phage integrase N-terminal SAM-like domain-containing protein [Pseudomonadales bacterium]
MTVQAKYITSILETFSTYLESLNVSPKLSEATTIKFVKFLQQKNNYDSWSTDELEKFIKSENLSSNTAILIKKYIEDFTPHQVDIFLHQFLNSLKNDDRSSSTIKNYRSDIAQFISLSQESQINKLFTQVEVKKFVKDQFAKKLKVGTVKRKLISIAQFATWAEDQKLISDVSFWITDIDSLFTSNKKEENPSGSEARNQKIGDDIQNRSNLKTSKMPKVSKKADEHLEDYLIGLEIDGHSDSTIKNYKSDIAQFIEFIGNLSLEAAITQENLNKFINYQKTKGLKQSSIKRKIVSLSQFSSWAEKRGDLKNTTLWLHVLAQKPIISSSSYKKLVPSTHSIELKLKNMDIPIQEDTSQPDNDQATDTESKSKSKNLIRRILKNNEVNNKSEKSKRWSLPMPKFIKDNNTASENEKRTYKSRLKESLKEFSRSLNSQKNKSLLPYFNLAMIFLFFLGIGYLGYVQFIQQTPGSLAYPTSPTRPNRELSFQGRLTDTAQNPITIATDMAFRLYDTGPGTGGTQLWNSGTCSVTPDQDGIFNVGLGDDCGSEISQDVFTENSNVWLEVDVDVETLSPRQSIKTVAYALNSETVQGYPISATGAATTNTILTMDSAGQVLLGEVSPTLKATSGTFSIEAQTLTLKTSSGSNGDIIISPDGLGEVLSTSYFSAPGATFSATYANGTSLVLKGGPSGTANIQEWQNGAGSALSVVDENGNIGIGSSNPGYALDVVGELNLTDAIRVAGSAGTSGYLLTSSAGGANTWTDPATLAVSNIWANTLNVLHPKNELASVVDLAIGGTSTASADILLQSNGKAYFGGNVGIGSTAPGYALDVVGELNLTDAIRVAGNAGTSGYLLTSSAGGANTWTDPATLAVSNIWANTLNVLHPKNELASVVDLAIGGTSTASADILLQSNGKAYFGGNVGIGTTTATGLLNVSGKATGKALTILNETGNQNIFVASASGTNRFVIQNNGNIGIGTTTPIGLLNVSGKATGKALTILNETGDQNIFVASASGTNRFVIQNNGNIGIGTTTPIGLLNVSGKATGKALTILNETGDQNIFVASASGTNRFVIQNAGNVGIGTVSPGQKLDVAGNIQLSAGSSLLFNGTGNKIVNASGINLGFQTSNQWNLFLNQGGNVGIGGTAADSTPTLFVANTGNVGIGSTTPGYALDVVGELNLTDAIRVAGSAGTSGYLLTSSAGGANTWTDPATLAVSNIWANTLNVLHPKNELASVVDLAIGGTSTASADILLQSNGKAYFGGNVGIGTTTASQLLDVAGDIELANYLYFGNGATEYLRWNGSDLIASDDFLPAADGVSSLGSSSSRWTELFVKGSSIHIGDDGNEAILGYNTTSNYLGFDPDGDTTSEVVILDNGNVGIGSTAPGYTLDVVGITAFHPPNGSLLLIDGTESKPRIFSGATIMYQSNNTTLQHLLTNQIGDTLTGTVVQIDGGSGYRNNISLLNVKNGDQNILTVQALTGGGNVGVGSVTPGYKLDVVGDVNMSGAVRAGGNAGTAGYLLTSSGGGANTWTDPATLGSGFSLWSNTANVLHPKNELASVVDLAIGGTSTASADILLQSNGKAYFGGNVGIGSTSPESILAMPGNNVITFSGVSAQDQDSSVGTDIYDNLQFRFGGGAGKSVQFLAGSTNLLSIAYSGATFNDAGVDSNFRIESDTDENTFYLDGGTSNVGIGTNIPQAKLEVAASIDSTSMILGSSAGIAFAIAKPSEGYGLYFGRSGSGDSWIQAGRTSTAIAYSMNLQASGGNVGIGTTSAIGKLNVSGKATGKALTILNETGDQNIFVASASGTNRFVIQNAGNVGIGTVSPGQKLDVAGNIQLSAGSSLLFNGTGNKIVNASGINLGFQTSNQWNLFLNQGGNVGIGGTAADSTPTLFVANTGNVGIGSTTPGYALDVVGELNLTDAIRVAGSAGTSGYLLTSSAGGANTWTDPATLAVSNIWANTLNVLHPKNELASVVDLAIGGTSTASADILLQSNGKAYFGGNVGIGTTTASQLLDVAGDIELANYLYFGNGATEYLRWNGSDLIASDDFLPAADGVSSLGSSSSRWTELFVKGSSIHIGDDGNEAILGYNTTSNYLGFDPDGDTTSEVVILDNGNVGIGTTTPIGLLNVSGKATGKALTILNETGDQNIFVASASGTNRFVIQNDGNIGIGTASPTHKLAVNGSGSFSQGIYARSTTSSDSYYFGQHPSKSEVLSIHSEIRPIVISASNNNGDYISFETGTTLTERLRITDAGNVGIGSTTPGYALDVVGELNLTDAIRVAGNAGTSGYLLTSSAGGANTWTDPATLAVSNIWANTLNVLHPKNELASVVDLAIGGTSTASADILLQSNGKAYFGGNVGIGTTTAGAKLQINTGADAAIGQIIKANSGSQTANLQEWQNSSGTPLSFISGTGRLEANLGTGNTNFFAGYLAGNSTNTGNNNVAIGYLSQTALTSGTKNISLGSYSLQAVTTGYSNFGLGRSALQNLTEGGNNVAIGDLALNTSTTELNNVAIGIQALTSLNWPGVGNSNSAIGYQVGNNLIQTRNATLVGNQAGYGATNTSSSNLTAIGYQAGYQGSVGSVMIGYQAGSNETGSNRLYIANSNTATPLIYGLFSGTGAGLTIHSQATDGVPLRVKGIASQASNLQEWQNSAGTVLGAVDENGNIGIGSSNPGYALDVVGELNLTDAIRVAGNAGTSGYLLTSSAGGANTWTDPASLGSGFSLWSNTANVLHPKNELASVVDLAIGGTSTASADILLQSNGKAYFGGNVGIGTTNPTQAAQINGILKVGNFTENYTTGYDIITNQYIKATGYNLRPPTMGDGGFTGFKSNDSGNTNISVWAGNNEVAVFDGYGNSTDSVLRLHGTVFNPSSGTGQKKYLDISPTISTSGTYDGSVVGIDYNPTVTSLTGSHYAALFRVGNVGIGTTTPIGLLNVSGKATGKALTILNETGDQNIFAASASGTNRFVIQNGGNVGIGTVSPGQKLDVAGNIQLSAGSSLLFNGTGNKIVNASGINLGFQTSNQWNLFLNQGGNVGIGGTAADSTPTLFVANTGNVGIGSTTPGYALDVVGELNLTDAIRVAGNAGTSGYLLTSSAGGANTWTDPATLAVSNIWANTLNVLHPKNELASVVDLAIGGTSTASADILLQSNGKAYFGGNVGIGTTTPGGTLELASGQLLLPNGTAAAPSLSFTNASGVGIRQNGAAIFFSKSGADLLGINNATAALAIQAGYALGFNSATGPSAFLLSDEANNISLRNSTNAQSFRIYNTYSSGTSYERGDFYWNSNVLNIGTSKGSSGGSARDLALLTDGTQRMIVNSSGNIGIGTTTPIGLLNISGKATGKALTILNETGNQDIFAASASGTNRFVIQNVGNVGIGSTAPGYTLDVVGELNLTDAIRVAGSAGTSGYLLTSSAGGANTWTDPASLGSGFSLWSNTANVLHPKDELASVVDLAIGGTSTASADILLQSNGKAYFGGNVGIGTNAPSQKLEIAGNLRTTGYLYFDNPTGSDLYIRRSAVNTMSFWAGSGPMTWQGTHLILGQWGSDVALSGPDAGLTNRYGQWLSIRSGTSWGSGAAAGLKFFYSPTGTAGGGTNGYIEGMRLDGNGNVGIGSTAPGYALDVVGELNLTDAIRVAGNAGTSGYLLTSSAGGANTWTDPATLAVSNIWANTLNVLHPKNELASVVDLAIGGTSTASADILLQSNGKAYFGGNVGIGTTNSGLNSTLAIKSSGSDDIIKFINPSNETLMSLTYNSGSGIWAAGTNKDIEFRTSATTGKKISFKTLSSSDSIRFSNSSDYSVFTSFEDRNVTIGHSVTPTGSLTIQTHTISTPTIAIKSITSQTANLTEWQNSAGTVLGAVDENGNIGIGSSNPGYALDVVGELNLTDAIRVAGNAGTSGYLLTSSAGGANTWTDPASLGSGFSLWSNTANVLHPKNELAGVVDLAIGGTSTASANIHLLANGSAIFNEQGSNADFRIEASGKTNALFLQGSSGNIGIGTNTPVGLLNIEGKVTGKSLFILNETGDQPIISASASGVLKFQVARDGFVYAERFVDNTNSSYYLDPASGGNSLLVAGNVGIGTTTGGYKLDLLDAGTTQTVRIKDSGGSGSMFLGARKLGFEAATIPGSIYSSISTPNSNGWPLEIYSRGYVNIYGIGGTSGNAVYSTGWINDGASAIAHQFRTGESFVTAGAKIISFINYTTEKAFINKDGGAYFGSNVGIGSTAPGYALDVVGELNLTDAIRVAGNAGTSGYLLTSSAGGANTWTDPASLGSGFSLWSNTANVLHPKNELASVVDLAIGGTSTASADILLQSNGKAYFGGNVGIGTTTAGAKLQINTGADAAIGQIIKANSGSQTANLQEWQDSSGNPKLTIDANGKLSMYGQLTSSWTQTAATDAQSAIFNWVIDPTSAGGNYSSVYGSAIHSNAQTISSLYGMNYLVSQQGDGTIAAATGVNTGVSSGTGKTITSPTGINILNQLSGSSTTVKGLNISQSVNSASNLYQLYVSAPTTTSVTSNYGIFVGDQQPSGTSTGIALYTGTQSGWTLYSTGGQSMHAGNIKFGAVATADRPVDITGATIIRGAADTQQFIVKGHSSQTANLTEWQNSAGTVLGIVNGNGNIGIGTSTAGVKLHINADGGSIPTLSSGTNFVANESSAASDNSFISVISGNTGNAGILFGDTDRDDSGRIQYEHGKDALSFFSNDTLAAILDNAGNFGVGQNSPTAKLEVIVDSANYVSKFFNDGNNANRLGLLIKAGADSGSGTLIQFNDGDGTDVGEITFSGTTTTYGTSSDIRLKENIRETNFSLADLLQVEVKDYEFISEDSKRTHTGFIAQQLAQIYPEAVYIPENPDEYWSVDYGKLTPLLVKAVQEQQLSLNSVTEQLSHIDPMIEIANTNDVVINEDNIVLNKYNVSSSQGLISKIALFSETVVGNIQAGMINTKKLVVQSTASINNLSVNSLTIGGKSITNYVTDIINNVTAGTTNDNSTLISPIGDDTAIKIDSDSGSVLFKNNTDVSVAQLSNKGDLNLSGSLTTQGNATISGSIKSSTLLSNELKTSIATISGKLSANEINASKTNLGILLAQEATISGSLNVANNATISGTLLANKVEATSARITALEAGIAELEKIKANTAEIVTATISGTLYADNIYNFEQTITNTLQTPGLLDLLIGKDSTTSASYMEELYDVINKSEFGATTSAQLDLSISDLSFLGNDVTLTGSSLFIEKYFKVNGAGYISDSLAVGNSIFVNNSLIIGTKDTNTSISNGIIAYNSISPDDQILKIQPQGKGSIELLAGIVTINDSGMVTVNGNFESTGDVKVGKTLLANLIKPTDFGNPFQVQVAGVDTQSGNIKESRFEIINEVGAPVATFSAQGKAEFAGGIGIGSQDLGSSTTNELNSEKTSGKATIKANASQVKIKSSSITDKTLIYVTAVGSTGNQVLYVKEQTAENQETPINEGEFVVGFDQATSSDVSFNWWLVN